MKLIREKLSMFFLFLCLLVAPKDMREILNNSLSMGMRVYRKAYDKIIKGL